MTLFFISLIALLPIIIWAYIFSYIDWDRLNRSRFIIGIFAWLIGVLPIVFFEQIFSFLKISSILNIFQKFNLLGYFSIIIVFFIFIAGISFLYSLFIQKSYRKTWKYIFSSFSIFCIFTIIISSSLYIIDYFWLLSYFSDNYNLIFHWTTITSFVLVLFYYLFIALIEELTKHTNFLWTSINNISTVQKWVLYTFYVTLGFVFFENILYIYNIYWNNWFGSDFFLVYFSRSIFSLMLHIFCSAVLTYYFLKAYFKYKTIFTFGFIKLLFIGITFSVFWHAFFDLSLELWWTFMMIIYFLLWYFYITGIFYKD